MKRVTIGESDGSILIGQLIELDGEHRFRVDGVIILYPFQSFSGGVFEIVHRATVRVSPKATEVGC